MPSTTEAIREGTVYNGRTHNADDVIPELIKELARIETRLDPGGTIRARESIKSSDTFRNWFQSEPDEEEKDEITAQLIEAINEWAPTGLVFGVHEGNATDYGWWKDEEAEEPPAMAAVAEPDVSDDEDDEDDEDEEDKKEE